MFWKRVWGKDSRWLQCNLETLMLIYILQECIRQTVVDHANKIRGADQTCADHDGEVFLLDQECQHFGVKHHSHYPHDEKANQHLFYENFQIPPDYVVEGAPPSSKAARGENLQLEQPVNGRDAPACDFPPTVPGMRSP